MANLRNRRTQLRVNCPDIVSDIDALEPIQSQYAASPRIVGLLVRKAALLDPGRDLMEWYDTCFNPQTAEGAGLDVWGRIVGIGRKMWTKSQSFFGFAFQDLQPMDNAPFWNEESSQGTVALSDDAYRFLLFYKAAANIGESTMPAVNEMLQMLFVEKHGPGSCFVLEHGPMHIRALFLFELTSYEVALLEQYALLNRPAGVFFEWWQVNPNATFGFAGQELQPFNQGVFNSFIPQVPSGFPSPVFGFGESGLTPFDQGVFSPFPNQPLS